MTKNLRWRVFIILAVFGLSVYSFFPPLDRTRVVEGKPVTVPGKVRLGLDLKGGVHLILRVQTDDALRLETETEMERLREELSRRSITPSAMTMVSPTEFRAEGLNSAQQAEFRAVADEQVSATFNRNDSTAGQSTFTMRPNLAVTFRNEAVRQALQTIERRVNELGVAEPIVALHGAAGDQILVQLPGVTDVERAKNIIQSTALLELKLVEQGPAPTREALVPTGTVPPAGLEVVSGLSDATGGDRPSTVYYLVRRVAAVSGRDLRNARPTLDENSQPAISFSLNQEGARKFRDVTGQNVGKNLAIILDSKVQLAPRIESQISDEGRISGSFTQQEVADVSLMLRSGALPASLTYLEQRMVGPSLGADSVRAGIMASIMGLGFVSLFMLGLLQARRHQCHRLGGVEPDHPAGFHVLRRRHDDASRHRGLHPDDWHGCRFERTHLRAHQGRAPGRPWRQGRRRGRIRSRFPHHSRHARGVAHRGGILVPVRDRAHSRVCHDPHLRAVVERFHRRLRFADAFRSGTVAPSGHDAQYLSLHHADVHEYQH